MDLSHFVSIGLWPAKRDPLTGPQLDYFKNHNVEENLADIISALAKQQPADPYQFIAEQVSKFSKSSSAAPAKAAPAAKAAEDKPKAKAEAKSEPKAKAKSEPKAKAKAEAKKEAKPAAAAPGGAVNEAAVTAVGGEIRTLKEKLKAGGMSGKDINSHPEVVALVAKLTELKAGGGAAASAPAPAAGGGAVDEAAIAAVGGEIRALKEKLKASGLSGKDINDNAEVKTLVAKLSELKGGGGGAAAPAPKAKAKAAAKEGAKPKAKAKADAKSNQPAKGGGMDIKKIDDVPEWYAQVIMKGELIEQYPVKGCFILRPWAYRIWELVQGWLDGKIKSTGVENCYFPMFIPKCYMEKESDHLDDFAPELAMVTKFGDSEIDEPVAIRPTSETAMYAAYSNWIQSHRDLPIKLNQWCSVVRWEVKQTTPFLRTREFLWQEGHSAFATKAEAEKEVFQILEFYAGVYEELMAIPVVRGRKTKAETFPGADYTTTVEAFIPATGRAIQGATSHHLGQNFSKMFDIEFQDPSDPTGKKREFAYQNSWGLTQRTIGVLVMVHGDDRGLVLPPNCAALQVVIVPVGIKNNSTDEEKAELAQVSRMYELQLRQAGLRVKLDEDNTYSPGWKFNHWEMKGVPLRLEVGPMDIKKGEFVMAKRNAADPKTGKVAGKHATVVEDVQRCLETIQKELYAKALAERDEHLASIDLWKDFSPNLNQGKMLLVPFCGEPECEEQIKEKSKEEAEDAEVAGGLKMGAKSLCVPCEERYNVKCPTKCINPDCKRNDVTRRTLFGRSY
eukprot:TRINITY_DN37002_c0_g1_i1.p1 TRINITY_DN37002_c0_g1~~TRINITY_DN37002_c0_g1_i1.p1  ORF type:complete len:788 (+),score=259.98 TRINITY_DN37002_c0_g1_i1:53-2416(+)